MCAEFSDGVSKRAPGFEPELGNISSHARDLLVT